MIMYPKNASMVIYLHLSSHLLTLSFRTYLILKNHPVLFKVDMARAFRNLPVDPADSLKFGPKVNYQYFLDKSVVFS